MARPDAEVVEVFGVRGVLQSHRGPLPPESAAATSRQPPVQQESLTTPPHQAYAPNVLDAYARLNQGHACPPSKGKGKGKGRGKGKGSSSPADQATPFFNPASPALLTSYIKNAATIDDFFRTYSSHGSRFNHIHLSACWNLRGRLGSGGADRAWFQRHAAALESLGQHTVRTISSSSDVRARELATIAHATLRSVNTRLSTTKSRWAPRDHWYLVPSRWLKCSG